MNYLFNFSIISTFIISISFLFCSCKINLSRSTQITSQQLTCTFNETNTQKYIEKYKSYFSGKYIDEAIQAISQVPEPYLENIFTEHKAKVEVISNGKYDSFYEPQVGDNVCGVTLFNDAIKTPANIRTTVICFPHELGHDAFYYLQSLNSNFSSELKKISSLIAQKYRSVSSAYLNQSNMDPEETLAELFRTWHCSQAARNLLKKDMPEVYEFAQNFLLDPEDDAYVGRKKNINVYIVKKSNSSLLDIYVNNNSDATTIKYCIGSSTICKDSSNHKSFNTTTISKGEVSVIKSISLNDITENTPLHIYGNNKLLRALYITKN